MAIKGGSTSLLTRAPLTAIYALCDPETGAVRYVGRSAQPEERLRQHVREADDMGRNYYKCRWLRSLFEPPAMEVLEWVDADRAVEAEGAWILELTRMGAALTNTGTEAQGGWGVAAWTAPGRVTKGQPRKVSPEGMARQKAARAKQVIGPRSDETKAKLSAYWTGRKKPPSQCEAFRRARQGTGSYNARLTDTAVLTIRAEVAAGTATRKELAERFGVSYQAVVDVVLRRRWKHI